MSWNTMKRDDRAVSIAVTHILTIGITTILISGLFVAGSGLLESEKDSATRSESRTIGNRLAGEMTSAFSSAKELNGGEIVLRTDHQSLIAGNTYTVEVRKSCSGSALPNSPPCLVIQAGNNQNTVKIALEPDLDLGNNDLVETTVSGGEIYIIVNDTGSGIKITLSNDPTPNLAPPRVSP